MGSGAPSPSSRKPGIAEHSPALTDEPLEASGELVKLRTIGPFTLSERYYAAAQTLAARVNREASITFVIEGVFREKYATGSLICRPGGVRFLPAGVQHSTEMDAELRCLEVRSAPEILDQLARQSVVPKKPAEINGLSITWLANRLHAEFSREDTASAIAIEGLVLAILAEIARVETKQVSQPVPSWLRQATKIVESRFLERLTLAAIASEVGVHYVHLSRQFHKYNQCTVGELIRRRRVQYASHLLAHSETPLAEIALICGFSDQSHLSFLFKRYMGVSPSKFRSVAGRDASGPVRLDRDAERNGQARVAHAPGK